ncbi:unnamed protein product [Toxocara canis]|uniref:REJ domain-containing protein n=1 Tax=Toxocara canis TaxID=6265 RepID=A0A183UTB0_TOXCA|nr:unnamed protein product [Toxocara canis]
MLYELFQNNFPPEGGICGVMPEVVAAFQKATANCIDWTDEDGVASYTFFKRLRSTDTPSLMSTSFNGSANFGLSAGRYEILVKISDSIGAQSEFISVGFVQGDDLPSNVSSIQATIEGLLDELNGTKRDADIIAALAGLLNNPSYLDHLTSLARNESLGKYDIPEELQQKLQALGSLNAKDRIAGGTTNGAHGRTSHKSFDQGAINADRQRHARIAESSKSRLVSQLVASRVVTYRMQPLIYDLGELKALLILLPFYKLSLVTHPRFLWFVVNKFATIMV